MNMNLYLFQACRLINVNLIINCTTYISFYENRLCFQLLAICMFAVTKRKSSYYYSLHIFRDGT